MTLYSIELRDRIFVKGYRFLFFAKNIGKTFRNNLRGKYSQKFLDHVKTFATDAIKPINKKTSWSNWWFDS